MNYKITDTSINLISSEESFRAYPYVDDYGPSPNIEYSIGYGHQIQPGETFTAPISKDTAKNILKADLSPRISALNDSLPQGLKQHQIDALLDLTMSMGPGAVRSSSLLKKIRAGEPREVIETYWKNYYIKSGGGINQGLKLRREREVNLFFSDGYTDFFLLILKIIVSLLTIYLLYLLFIKK